MTLRPKMRKVKKWPFWGDFWTFGLPDLWPKIHQKWSENIIFVFSEKNQYRT